MKPKKAPLTPASKKSQAKHRASQAAPAGRFAAKSLPLNIREILVPVDFSDHSRVAFDYAVQFAAKFKARLALIHIVEQVVYPGDWVFAPVPGPAVVGEPTEDLVERLRAFAGSSGKKITPIVRLGRPWHQIVEVAKARKSDLIISATHGHTGLQHVLLGSVAEKIVRHAPCPVLTVRSE
jgi:universal stress protein A